MERFAVGVRRRSAPVLPLAGLVLAALAAAGLAVAQPSGTRRTVWEGAYTDAQAARGAQSFAQSCARCHALDEQGKSPLVGEPFWKSFQQKTVGEVVEFVTAYMPNGSPRSLTDAVYADIVAAMLKSNGFPAGAAEIGPGTASFEILPRDGSTELPANALVRVVGCLAAGNADQKRDGANWVVINATTPERAEQASSREQDAARPLGSRTMPLKFVLTKLDAMVGSRVVVNGLQIGSGGVDGLNVTQVNRVAETCP